MKTRRLTIALAATIAFSLLASSSTSAGRRPALPGPATGERGPLPEGLSTPELIEAALSAGEIDRETANLYLAYALTDYERLPVEFHSDVRWHGTLYLMELRQDMQTMGVGATRARIEGLLAGTCGDSAAALPAARNTAHFHIQHGAIGGGLDINDYVDSLETSWAREIDDFGWAAPPVLAGSPPPGNRYHVRIDNLGGGLAGYVDWYGTHAGFVGDNPNTLWNDGDAWASCMVLNRSFGSLEVLQATAAHELNHAIQGGLGSFVGTASSFIEGGAVWMEDEVFDTSNDNYQFLWPPFDTCLPQIGESSYNDTYLAWIAFRGITERYGTGIAGGGEQVMQDFWEATSRGLGSNLGAMNMALANRGTTLADAYHGYAIAVKFNKPCGGYVYPYCFEEATAYVSAKGPTALHGSISAVGESYSGAVQDNYALNWISLPNNGGPYDVTLRNTSGGGELRASVVCDTGSTLNVHSLPSVVGPGDSRTLDTFSPSGCKEVVAVITNQAQTADNPTSCTSRSYTLETTRGAGLSPRVYLPLVARMPPPVEIPLDAGEADVPADRSVHLTTQWYADTPEYVNDYLDALVLTVTVDGSDLVDVRDHWGSIIPSGDIDQDGDVDYVARWRYPVGILAPGDHAVASTFHLPYAITDGFDWDDDGSLDVFVGSWQYELQVEVGG